MKKFLLVVAVVLMMTGVLFADNEIWTYQTINTSGSLYKETVVPVTSIYPDSDQILGWGIMKYDTTLNAEHVVVLYDQATTGVTSISGECLGESESSNTPVDNTLWLPYPRVVRYGVMVRQGPNTVATVYFSRR